MSSSHDVSRRSFIKAGIAGAAASLSVESSPASQLQAGELTYLGLGDSSELVRRRKISPTELTKACLARIDQLQPTLNAFITVTAESALAQARSAETEIHRGNWRGPLHGIPIALKDLFDTAGTKTTAGSAVFIDRIPKNDAEVVRRLKAAGAVLVGKTNMHEFAYGGTSVVSHFGAVRNPWKLDYIAGGSSGGSAAAVAAGLCYGALGSDTGGSIRQPSAYCALVGLKPTYGLVSTRGVIPLSWSFDHVGPMTRTVADAALVLQAIAGYDPDETTSVQMNVPDYAAALRVPARLRIGVARDFFFDGLHPEIEAAVSKALSVLEELTGPLRDVAIPASTQEELRATVRAAEAYAYHADLIAKRAERYHPETLTRLRAGAAIAASAYIHGLRELAATRRTIGQAFQAVDAVVTPTTPVPPSTIAEFNTDVASAVAKATLTIRNTSPFNYYGWPTVSIPCGFTQAGLPIGLQISGPAGKDATVLRIAHAYEQATGWHARRPGIG